MGVWDEPSEPDKNKKKGFLHSFTLSAILNVNTQKEVVT